MQVTGKNLLNVCKLLFALSRVESNDEHFTFVPVTGSAEGCVLMCAWKHITMQRDTDTYVPALFDKRWNVFYCVLSSTVWLCYRPWQSLSSLTLL